MKKNRFFLSEGVLLAVILSSLFCAGEACAEDSSETQNLPVTRTWMLDALRKIETRLTVIEENQKAILDGQKQLSEEHTQLRYWVHRS